MATYRVTFKQRVIQRYRREGAEMMRALVIGVLEDRLPNLELNGRSAAEIVREIRI